MPPPSAIKLTFDREQLPTPTTRLAHFAEQAVQCARSVLGAYAWD